MDPRSALPLSDQPASATKNGAHSELSVKKEPKVKKEILPRKVEKMVKSKAEKARRTKKYQKKSDILTRDESEPTAAADNLAKAMALGEQFTGVKFDFVSVLHH